MSFQGYVSLSATFKGVIVAKDASDTPTEPAAAPTFRVYSPSGYLINGTAAKLDTGTITGVSIASPAVITCAAHGLTTGARVTISGVTGTGAITNVNTTEVVTRIDANTFSIPVSTVGGTYTSGGTWTLTGCYRISVDCTAGNGFAAGEVYTAVVVFSVGGVQKGELVTWNVV